MKIEFAPAAQTEFAAAARWYAKDAGAKYARDFKNEIRRMINLIVQYPDMGTKISGTARRLVATRFPYNIIYQFDKSTLHIIAVAHQSRRPEYWKGRP